MDYPCRPRTLPKDPDLGIIQSESELRIFCSHSACFRVFIGRDSTAVREFANESAASAASPVYIKFQAVIKSAASAASLRGGRASGRLDHGFFSHFLAALAAKKYVLVQKK